MSQGSTNAAVGGDNEDRISALPGNVIDHILELLPAQDAAKTSILSKNWRYIWRKLPYLMLDYRIHNRFRGKSESSFRQAVDSILSQHLGDIVKFKLDIIDQRRSSYAYRRSPYEDVDILYEDVDRWMRHVARDGIKELAVCFPEHVDLEDDALDGRIYELPSCVFNCTTLAHLELCYCVFKPPISSLDFPKLETLYLQGINIVPTTEFCLLNVPLLVNLNLLGCNGTQYLHIVSPLLEALAVCEVHYVVLNYFMKCKKLRELHLSFFDMVGNTNHDERSTVEKLLFSLTPTLEKLGLGTSILELLNAGTIPRGPFFMLNCLRDISSIVDFGKFNQTSGLLQLITSVPNLSKLEIMVDGTRDNANAIKKYKKYLNSPACSDKSINKLEHVVMRFFQGSQIELLFVKLLLARTPSLIKMSIEHVRFKEERSLPGELISCLKASPNAQLYFIQDRVSSS